MNWREAETMYDFATEVGADAVYFTVLDPVPGKTDVLLLNADERAAARNILRGIHARYEESPESLPELENYDGVIRRLGEDSAADGHYDGAAVEGIPCYIGWMFIRVLPNGDISPCCRGVDKPLGNLFRNSFSEIWNSPEYEEFRHFALTESKSHPYFAPIRCHTTCDNLMHNETMHGRIHALSEDEKAALKECADREIAASQRFSQ